jgi:hypothetical protein
VIFRGWSSAFAQLAVHPSRGWHGQQICVPYCVFIRDFICPTFGIVCRTHSREVQSRVECDKERPDSREAAMTDFHPASASGARRLVVVLHGYQSAKHGRFERLVAAIREDMPDADVLAPRLETAHVLSTKPAAAIAGDMIEKIDHHWQQHGSYDEIIFVGHSTGGALARKVMLGAWGVGRRVPFESTGGFDRFTSQRVWAAKITRLVMIAGISSGWKASGRERWKEWLSLNFFGLLGHLMPRVKPTIFDFRRGAPFIANTRLQMVDHLREQAQGSRPRSMTTVQMLGSNDGIVAPNESLDFNASNALDDQLFIVEVPFSDHVSILDVSLTEKKNVAAAARRDMLRSALYGQVHGRGGGGAFPAQPLFDVARDWHELDDHMPRGADPGVENVVLVIHGIRDDGHWTKKIAARVKDAASNPHLWRSVTPSYGYFAMLPFVLPWIRRQKVEWLMHEYCEAVAQYPNATFHYVGHSNGTYLGAAAMRDYQGCHFQRVVFAGSVVHPGYDWAARAVDSGVIAVVNYVATRDWVVAMAPNALRHLRWLFDLGGAGHVGFGPQVPPFVNNLSYISGGHSAAIAEERWDEIAAFIVNGAIPPTKTIPNAFQPRQRFDIRAFAKASPFFAACLIALILGVLVDMATAAAELPSPSWFAGLMSFVESVPGIGWIASELGRFTTSLSQWWSSCWQPVKLVGLVAYVGLLRFIVTRF